MKAHTTSKYACWTAILCLRVGLGTTVHGQSGFSLYSYDQAGNLQEVLVTNPSPVVISQPAPALLQSNSLATFSVVVTGAGLTYQWLSNGIPIPGATGDSLIMANLPLLGTSLGNFSVIVSGLGGSVTSAPAALWADLNGNGIPDWWEMQYFHNLNQPAFGDYDGDGVDNLDEYSEGTNPTNALSFNPRLHLQAAKGSGQVIASPDLPYYTMGQLVTLTAIPDDGQGFAGWSGAITGAKSTVALIMSTNESVTANFGFPLGVALNNTNLVWTTAGDALWFGQADVSEDGIAAAQSGPIVSYYNGGNFVGDQTTLQTSFYLAQAEQLGFWWSVSSQPPDGVSFAINSNLVATLSGQAVAWQYVQTNLAAGVYTLTWTYSKGPVNIPDGIPYDDAAWVGDVTLGSVMPIAPALSIVSSGGGGVLLYWPATTAVFRLQQTASLNPAAWINTTNPIALVNGASQVSVPAQSQSQFYRLVYP
jgi:hypothetical protein